MSRRILNIALSFVVIISSFGMLMSQEAGSTFEGVVKYRFMMQNPAGMTDEQRNEMMTQMESMMGKHFVYSFKENKMKTELDGQLMKLTYYYFGGDSIYMMDDLSPEVQIAPVDDGWNFEYSTVERVPNAKEVQGIMCDLIVFKSDKYSWKYYYNTQYKLSPTFFEKYKSGFWNKAIEETGSLPLEFEGKISGSYLFMTADEIIEGPVDDAVFELPGN